MPDTEAFDQHYRALSDEELLKLAAEGGFTAEAAQVLGKELARRNLTFDEAKRNFAPEWLDKADEGTLGILTWIEFAGCRGFGSKRDYGPSDRGRRVRNLRSDLPR